MIDLSELREKSKILVVDDNPVNVALLTEMLGNAGYALVSGITDPTQVRDLHARHHYDLIMLDIRMPQVDGFEVMEQLSVDDSSGYLSVLVLTAQNDNDTKLRALESGAKDFITKPFHQAEVLHRVRNLLEVRLLYNRQLNVNEMLEDSVRRRTQELEETRLEIVRRLGRAGEFRDNETGMHVIRMSKSCELLATAAGLSGDDAQLILHASPMHDVGKIGIPDGILLKPGALDPGEWEIMKSHTTIGGEILSGNGSVLLRMAHSIALSHHEKWDGSGYPRGLKANDIPFVGRITALCDVFDALTSSRPYKEAWDIAKATSYVAENAGKQFDPVLTKHFLDILPNILRVRDAHADSGEAA